MTRYGRGRRTTSRGRSSLLHAMISKGGPPTSLIVIESPDSSLSDAAMTAVRNWKYQPYLLNGQPTDVDTTIEVNFNLGG